MAARNDPLENIFNRQRPIHNIVKHWVLNDNKHYLYFGTTDPVRAQSDLFMSSWIQAHSLVTDLTLEHLRKENWLFGSINVTDCQHNESKLFQSTEVNIFLTATKPPYFYLPNKRVYTPYLILVHLPPCMILFRPSKRLLIFEKKNSVRIKWSFNPFPNMHNY